MRIKLTMVYSPSLVTIVPSEASILSSMVDSNLKIESKTDSLLSNGLRPGFFYKGATHIIILDRVLKL